MNKLDKMLAEIPKDMSEKSRKRLETTIIEEYEAHLKELGFSGTSFVSIRKKRRELDEKATQIALANKALQEECQHVNSTYESRGSTGNWDRDDRYWYEWNCSDCGKHWTGDQGLKETKKYPFATKISKY